MPDAEVSDIFFFSRPPSWGQGPAAFCRDVPGPLLNGAPQHGRCGASVADGLKMTSNESRPRSWSRGCVAGVTHVRVPVGPCWLARHRSAWWGRASG